MTFWQAIKAGIYESRYKLLATVIVLCVWMAFAHGVVYLLGDTALTIFIAIIAGYYWLGSVIVPWVEQKITPR